MKKSKRGIKTPKSEIDLIRKRLKAAEKDHKQLQEEKVDQNAAKPKENS